MFASKFGANTTLGGLTDGASGQLTGNEVGIPTAINFSNWSDLSGFSDKTLGDIDWQSIINQGFAVGSQAITAFSGAHGGTQIGYNTSQGGIFAIQATRPVYDEATMYANPYAGMNAQQIAALQNRGGVAEDALTSTANFVSQHPIMVFGAIAALFLLYREPPRRR